MSNSPKSNRIKMIIASVATLAAAVILYINYGPSPSARSNTSTPSSSKPVATSNEAPAAGGNYKRKGENSATDDDRPHGGPQLAPGN